MPAGTAQLFVQLVDSYGNPQPTPTSLTWGSTDPTVLTVSSSGLVTAVAVGSAAVTVTDGTHGTQTVGIDVAAIPPTGPVAVQFTPPLVQMAAGATAKEAFIVTGANGTTITPTPALTFQSLSPNVATMSAAGGVQALSAGVATMLAFLPASMTPLAGSLPVLVSARPTAPGGGSSGAGSSGGGSSGSSSGNGVSSPCDPTQYAIVGCLITNGGDPFVMNKPGLTYPVTVEVYWTQSDPTCSAPILGYAQQGNPDAVAFTTTGIGTYSASTGLVTSVAPGSTTFHPSVSGTECEGSWDGNPLRVGVDIGGSWAVTGSNGDEGSVTVPALPDKVKPGATWGGGTGVIATTLDGTSCISNSMGGFCCPCPADPSSAGSGTSQGGAGYEEQLCSESQPCTSGAGFTTCAPASRSGTDGSLVYGKDHVGFGIYDFHRGGGICGGPQDAGGSCDGVYTITVPSFECAGESVMGFSYTVTIVNDMGTTNLPDDDAGPAAIPSDCTIVGTTDNPPCAPLSDTITYANNGACGFGVALLVNGACACDIVAPCSISKQ
jgi:hypothetical protein